MVEGVVVVSELSALVVEIDLLLAVKFALKGMSDLGRGNSIPEVINEVLSIPDRLASLLDRLLVNIYDISAIMVHLAPAPESVVLT